MKSSISVEGLSFSYGPKPVLSNIYLQAEAGHLIGLMGPNGAGKSTLFKCILQLEEPTAGKILINDRPFREVRSKVAYVPQKSEVDWSFPATVYDVVMMGRYPYKKVFSRMTAEDKKIATDAMEAMNIVPLRNQTLGSLSGGQQQRVFLARALCQQADIFLMDEPFVGVDATTEARIIKLLKDLVLAGKLVMVVHHDLSTVEAYFDQVILLNQRLVSFGNTAEVFTPENIGQAYGGQLTILNKTAAPQLWNRSGK